MLLLTLLDNVAAEIQDLTPGHGRRNTSIRIRIYIYFKILLSNIMRCMASKSV